MDFVVLGPLGIHTPAGPLDAGPPQQRSVLAAILVDAGRPVRLETIVERAWGASPPREVRRALYVHVSRLRRLLGEASALGGTPARLERRSAGYLLDVEPERVDLHRFRRLTAMARDPALPDAQRVAHLRRALALWRGLPLAGLAGDWVDRLRESWSRQRIGAIVRWAETELRLGNAGALVDPLSELNAEYPLVEPLTAALMRALHAQGRLAEALDCYARARRVLAAELGVDAGAELRRLHQALLRDGYRPRAPTAPGRPRPRISSCGPRPRTR